MVLSQKGAVQDHQLEVNLCCTQTLWTARLQQQLQAKQARIPNQDWQFAYPCSPCMPGPGQGQLDCTAAPHMVSLARSDLSCSWVRKHISAALAVLSPTSSVSKKASHSDFWTCKLAVRSVATCSARRLAIERAVSRPRAMIESINCVLVVSTQP